MKASRAAAAVVAGLAGAGLVAVMAAHALLARGVSVAGWSVRAEGVWPAADGFSFEALTVERPTLRVEAPRGRISWSLAEASLPLARVWRSDEHESDVRVDEAPGAGRVHALALAIERVEVREGDAARDTLVAHGVRVDRRADRSLELHVARAELERGGLAFALEQVSASRAVDRRWSLALAHVAVRTGEGEPRAAEAPRVEARDHVDFAANVLEESFVRGGDVLERLVARVPRGSARIESLALDDLPWLGRTGLRADGVSVVREDDDVRVAATLATADSREPLALTMSANRVSGRVVADVRGGPLVLRRGDGRRGEIEADGRLVFDATVRSVEAQGTLGVRGLSLQRSWLGGEPFDVSARVTGRLSLDPTGSFRLSDAAFEVGDARELRGHVDARGSIRALELRVDASLEPFACDAGVRALPAPFRGTVGQLRFEGTKSLAVHLETSAARPEDTRLDVSERGSCTATSAPASLAPEAFDGEFVLPVIAADGTERFESFGPGNERWRPLGRVSRAFLAAVLTTEDAGFFRHKGVSWFAIRSALVDDVKARRFVRGGSTISMQLAKNLFLHREKTLARKLEEILLTDYLEDAFGKERILELYANIVELGPDVFGIEAAAQHHFGVGADELGVLEGFWLATLLPNPRERGHARRDGTVSEGKLKELRFLVRKARGHRLLSDEDVDEAERSSLHMPRMAGETPRVPGLGIGAPPTRGHGEAVIQGP